MSLPRLTADRLLFPLAAAFAGLAVPLGLATSGTPLGHGHEMLFGYALAVVAAFLATRPGVWTPWLLLASWLAGRVVVGTGGSGPLAALIDLAFPVVLLAVGVPPLLKAAKRPENRIAPGVVTALLLADAAWWLGALRADPELQFRALLAALDLYTLLLLVIGGRALAAAIGGYLERQGIPRRDLIRRGYELPFAALLGAIGVCDLFGFASLAGGLGLAAALLTLARLGFWQLHRSLGYPPLWPLALGYVWLVPGLALKGLAQLDIGPALPDALHGLAIGALGTLTLVMMARTAVLRARQPLIEFGDVAVAGLLVTLAALLRLATTSAEPALLWAAASAWTAACAVLLARLLKTRRR